MADIPRSHVECLGSEHSRCGYCRARRTSRNFGVWAHRLDVQDYQALLDAGWRRSGLYLYRPDMVNTCCPCYVIRLDASRFSPSTTHKRVLKRLRRFAADPALPHLSSAVSSSTNQNLPQTEISTKQPAPPLVERIRQSVSSAISDAIHAILQSSHDAPSFVSTHIAHSVSSDIKVFPPRQFPNSKMKKRRSGPSATSNSSPPEQRDSPPTFISNVALLLCAAERKLKESVPAMQEGLGNAQGTDGASEKKKRKMTDLAKRNQIERQINLAQMIVKHLESSIPDIRRISVTEPGFLNFWVREKEKETQDVQMMHENVITDMQRDWDGRKDTTLSERLQSVSKTTSEAFHGAFPTEKIPFSRVGSDVSSERTGGPSGYPSPDTSANPEPMDGKDTPQDAILEENRGILGELSEGKSFTMELAPSEFTVEAYEVFRKYQMAVHREPASQCSEDTFRRFLVESPLIQARSPVDPEHRYGSFHMMYRIHGRLFAVGVVDVLPRCLSSVYLFYDPEFAKLSPGTLSAVKEIEWVKKASVVFPSLQFYYMGYYIHSCAKMRYKAAFHPSEILCEQTKNWIPSKEAQAVLENAQGRQLRLAPEGMPQAPEAENFAFEDSELDQMTTDSKLRVNFGQDDQRVLSFGSLERLLFSRCSEQINLLRRKLRKFVELVGKASSRFYLHDA